MNEEKIRTKIRETYGRFYKTGRHKGKYDGRRVRELWNTYLILQACSWEEAQRCFSKSGFKRNIKELQAIGLSERFLKELHVKYLEVNPLKIVKPVAQNLQVINIIPLSEVPDWNADTEYSELVKPRKERIKYSDNDDEGLF